MGTAKHRAIDAIRRRETLERKHEEIGRDIERAQEGSELDGAIDEDVGDDLLGLMFMACHPVLSKDARVALTLRVLGGLTTEEIARAFLVPLSSIAQRIVRAKRTLAEARVRFEVPHGPERVARLSSVLEVIYLIFNEGYSATAGLDWVRPELCEEALRLGRILVELAPSPVVELNRAVAVGMAFGPAAGLDLVDALVAEPSLKAYHLLPAVRGDLLRKLGRSHEARIEFERAASLTANLPERQLLQRRAAECAAELPPVH
jgi:predicted RNA polymerase sigma factor